MNCLIIEEMREINKLQDIALANLMKEVVYNSHDNLLLNYQTHEFATVHKNWNVQSFTELPSTGKLI